MRFMKKKTLLPLFLGLVCPSLLLAADYRFVPSIGVSEDVTDNVYETPYGRHVDMVTRVQPGGALQYASSSNTLDAAYTLDYHHYALNTLTDEISHTLEVRGAFTLIEDFLKLDLTENFSRISLDVARDNTPESLSFNQTDQNTLLVSPYMLWHLGPRATLKTGLRYVDTRYWSLLGIDSRQQGAFAQLTYALKPRLSLTAECVFNNTVTQPLRYDNYDVSVGLRYEYAAKSFIFGSIGNNWQTFSTGNSMNNPIWDVGVISDFGTVVATLESHVQYTQDPLTASERQTSYSAKLEKIMPRATLNLSAAYNDYLDEAGVLAQSQSRHGTTIVVGASREVSPRLTASLNVTGDQFSRVAWLDQTALDYPYHLAVTGSLGYAMSHEATFGFTYTYATYRNRIDEANGSVEVNRVVFQVRKAF